MNRSSKGLAGTIAGLLFALLAPTACGIVDDRRPAQYADLANRTRFDLRCDRVEIHAIKEVENGASCTTTSHFAQTAGVRCGDKQATYEYDRYRWIMNNGIVEQAK